MDQKLAWAPKGPHGIRISGIKKSKRQVENFLKNVYTRDRLAIVPVLITEISDEEAAQ